MAAARCFVFMPPIGWFTLILLDVAPDGLSVLASHFWETVVFFVTVFGLGILITRRIAGGNLGPGICVLIAPAVGSMALSVFSFALVGLAHFWPSLLRPGGFVIVGLALFAILQEARNGEWKTAFDAGSAAAGLLLFFLLVVRLAFLRHLLLPSYSDSPIHYQIVRGFLDPSAEGDANLSLGNLFTHYYHFGFHSLAAWLASLTGAAPGDAISLVGQFLLTLAPVSVAFFAYVITNDRWGAFFAGGLAAFGWAMPAFAVNWGKFPALASLSAMPAALACLGLAWRGKTRSPKNLALTFLLLAGVSLMHTRIIVCIGLAVAGWFLAVKFQPPGELGFVRSLWLSVMHLVSLWPILQLLNDFYSGIPTAIVWLVLLPFAYQFHPRVSVGIFLFMLGLWLAALAPSLLVEHSRTLLDRQFLEIMLYIPLSVMGGAGFAGLMKKIPTKGLVRWTVVVSLAGSVCFTFLRGSSTYPDPCCVYFKEDDQSAFQWMETNVSRRALVVIAAFDEQGQTMGTDAGIWLQPLVGWETNKLPYDTHWDSESVIEDVCRSGAREIYVYVGGMPYSFDHAQLASTQWFQSVFSSGRTAIYQITNCGK